MSSEIQAALVERFIKDNNGINASTEICETYGN